MSINPVIPKKSKHNQFVDTIDEVFSGALKNGVWHLSTEDQQLKGRTIKIRGQDLVNFGSCSYLGLETDSRVIEGGVDAVRRYGSQVSASRAYLSCGLYDELEDLLQKIFGQPVVVAPTTTLGHLSSIPIIVQEDDLVVLDQQVHASVYTAVQMLKIRGIRVEMIRHSNLSELEDLLRNESGKYRKIWYMIDGVYSMFGDLSPAQDLEFLLNKYSSFHLFVDDAHGMSWTGENGRGYFLSKVKMNSKMIVSTSLAKAFGTGGGVIICPDKETARKIRTCGGTMIFSGPIQPPTLGGSVASAKIHLSPEIYTLQSDLKRQIDLMNILANEYHLPIIQQQESPICFIGTGMPKTGYNLSRKLMDEGFYTNLAIFPAVSVSKTGLRVTITNQQTEQDIRDLMSAVRDNFAQVLDEEGIQRNEIQKVFGLSLFNIQKDENDELEKRECKVEVFNSINQIDKALWDSYLGSRGSFDWEGMRFLEKAFVLQPKPENNWKFKYYKVLDKKGKMLALTFCTASRWKDDMLSPDFVSRKIEEIRLDKPSYLTSRVYTMGSLLTEGDHLYIDRTNPEWEEGLKLLLKQIKKDSQSFKCTTLVLRDLDGQDSKMKSFLLDEGCFTTKMPLKFELDITWGNEEEYLTILSKKSTKFVQKEVLSRKDLFLLEEVTNVVPEELDHLYRLYKNVKNKSLELNTFDIPKNVFKRMVNDSHWKVMSLSLKEGNNKPIAVVFVYRSAQVYCPMVIGLDYDYLELGIYRQMIYQCIMDAFKSGNKVVQLGFGAPMEKSRFGAKASNTLAYVQAEDNFNMSLLASVTAEVGRKMNK